MAKTRKRGIWLFAGAFFLVLAPFILLHLAAWYFLARDVALPGTEQRVVRPAGGLPFTADWRFVPHPRVTIIFVHGTPATASAFRSQMAFAFPGADLVAYDRPGFGRSKGTRALATLDAQTSALLALIREARTPGVVLVGHSYGAPIALHAAALEPGRVVGVVTIGGSVSPAEEHPWPIQSFAAWPIVSALLPAAARSSNEELLALKDDLERLDRHLAAVRCPILMLQGDLDEQVPAGNVAYLKARFAALGRPSQVEGRILPDYNHFMMWEHPEEVNRAIAAFVAQRLQAGDREEVDDSITARPDGGE